MALTVEDGTGLANADAYISLVYFTDYATAMAISTAGKTDEQIEAAIRQATMAVDGRYRFAGRKATSSQALEFPRADAVDWDGLEITGIPARVKRATAEFAGAALVSPLTAVLARGGKVKSESVGSISVTYADDAPVVAVVQAADEQLQPLLRTEGVNMTAATLTLADGGAGTRIDSGLVYSSLTDE